MTFPRTLAVGVMLSLSLAAVASLAAAQQIEEARDAYRTGRYEQAIDIYQTAARRDRTSVPAARGLSRALFDVGRYDDAGQVARRFTRSNPNSPELQNSLGRALYAKGEIDEAEVAFARAVEAGAGDALDAWLNLAVLYYERGDRQAAKTEFVGLIDVYNRRRGLSSEELTAVGTAMRYLRSDDWQYSRDALRIYDEAIAADPANLDPRVAVGELFLEAYAGGEASSAFEDVLQVNPSEPRALVGKARQLRFAGSLGAMETVQRAIKLNPNLVAARVLMGELLLELEEYDAAAQEIERALEVNPVSLEALSVMAATRFLQGEDAEFEELRAKVLDLNPRYADLYVRLAETSARNRLYGQAVDFARQAVELDERSWRGYAVLGVNELRIGAIDEGTSHLEVAFKGDPYDIWTKNTLDMLDTFEDYTEERTDRFVFVIDGNESELLSLYLRKLADEAYTRLADKYGYEAPTPIRVEVFRSHADFSVRTIGLVGLGALGVSFGPVIAMNSPSARDASEFNWGSTFWHELAHSFHLGLSDHRVPRWFSEGLAVHEERVARPGWGDDVSVSFLMAHLHELLLPVGELNNGFARPTYPEQVVHSYYQASLVFDLIERDYGGRAIVSMLEGYRDGLSNEQVFEHVLGTSVDDFNRLFFDYLEHRFEGPLDALRPNLHAPSEGRGPGEPLVDDPNSFLAQLDHGHSYVEQGRYEEAVPHLERAKQLFPEFAGSGSPYWYLALIHKERGNLERAEAELAALTAINERDYQANLELAAIRESMGDIAGAAEALARTAYIYPYDIKLHARLAELLSGSGDVQGAIRERRAVLALDPVDKAEALYQLARAYFEAGDLASARRFILRVLEDAPSYEEAQELLLEIHGQGGGTR